MNKSITDFFSEDHDHLDEIFSHFQKAKQREPAKARQFFTEFRNGLEQHMAWEEAVLFSAYETKTGDTEGPTVSLREDHELIRDRLNAIEQKLNHGSTDTKAEEKLFQRALDEHNIEEESDFYKRLDALISVDERKEIFASMKSAQWNP